MTTLKSDSILSNLLFIQLDPRRLPSSLVEIDPYTIFETFYRG